VADIRHCRSGQARLVATIEGLTDEQGRPPSEPPDWTIAHVLTHVARNAHGHARRDDCGRSRCPRRSGRRLPAFPPARGLRGVGDTNDLAVNGLVDFSLRGSRSATAPTIWGKRVVRGRWEARRGRRRRGAQAGRRPHDVARGRLRRPMPRLDRTVLHGAGVSLPKHWVQARPSSKRPRLFWCRCAIKARGLRRPPGFS
jgi:Mycothiol maleylpyruvate isomerase N-terminal domain